IAAQKLVFDLRKYGIHAERDLCDRSVKAQMKYANKLGAKYSMVLGEDEITAKQADIKNMETGETTSVALTAEAIRSILEG
ncbi:MAG: histidine--tRNA ligase, partial [Clostridia bacterium]|nr:histidine--tRNA ligase [Clostridia bacterium]